MKIPWFNLLNTKKRVRTCNAIVVKHFMSIVGVFYFNLSVPIDIRPIHLQEAKLSLG